MVAPDKKDRKRPYELLVISAILSIFAGLIVLMSTRSPTLAGISFGIAFIVSLVVLAMLALAIKPTGDEQADLDEQNRSERRGH